MRDPRPMDPRPARTPRRRRDAERALRPIGAALRSGLRRYPRELLASLAAPRAGHEVPARQILHELAPHGMAVAWLGHASVLATLGEAMVAVDPVLSPRIGMRIGRWVFGLSRRTPPPVLAESLKGLDLILITHAHYDHLDKPTLAQLADPRTTVVVPAGCAKLVPPGYGSVIELPCQQRLTLGSVTIESLPPRHWGARAWLDRKRGVNAYLVRHAEGAILFAGDTAQTSAFDNLPNIDVAVFGIGAYNPWEHMHATPEQVWRMFIACGGRYLLPVHHSTFELSDEPMDEPLARLRAAAGDDGHRVIEEQPGEIVVIPASEQRLDEPAPATRGQPRSVDGG
jgi:L-ascorbate metabolism protein UlaG (beta-lactamase superfamily)